MHTFGYTNGDTRLLLAPGWPWVTGYACMAALFFVAKWVTQPDDAGH
jgi:hypothetical protein